MSFASVTESVYSEVVVGGQHGECSRGFLVVVAGIVYAFDGQEESFYGSVGHIVRSRM